MTPDLNRDRLKEILGETYDYLEAENGSQVTQLLGGIVELIGCF